MAQDNRRAIDPEVQFSSSVPGFQESVAILRVMPETAVVIERIVATFSTVIDVTVGSTRLVLVLVKPEMTDRFKALNDLRQPFLYAGRSGTTGVTLR